MRETAITYIQQALRLLKTHYQILLIPLFIGFVSNILSVLAGDGLYTLSLIVRISIIAIIPVIYGRINEIVCNRDFKSWKNLFSKYFLKYQLFIVTVFLVMSVPVVILTTLGAFLIINFNLNHVLTVVSILYHLIALYVVPFSFWVHKHVDHEIWSYAKEFKPPLTKAIPCKGYPLLIVNAFGIELEFASVAEVEHFLAVISEKNMPTTQQLSRQRTDNYGPNRHWLSRLPSSLKPWSKREQIIPIVESALNEFKIVCAYADANNRLRKDSGQKAALTCEPRVMSIRK